MWPFDRRVAGGRPTRHHWGDMTALLTAIGALPALLGFVLDREKLMIGTLGILGLAALVVAIGAIVLITRQRPPPAGAPPASPVD